MGVMNLTFEIDYWDHPGWFNNFANGFMNRDMEYETCLELMLKELSDCGISWENIDGDKPILTFPDEQTYLMFVLRWAK